MAFIDREKIGKYGGKEIGYLEVIEQSGYDKIIIMLQDIQECINVSKELLTKGVSAEAIVLGRSLFGEYAKTISKMKIQSDGRLLLKFADIFIKIKSDDEFNNVYEVFVGQIYNYFVNNGKQDIVLDVGMNIGDTTLYFAMRENVEKVYGYEPFKETFIDAQENLKNNSFTDKIEILNYGISNENAMRKIGYNSDMSCGQSSISDVRESAYSTYLNWGLVNPLSEQIEQIEVRKASEVFAPIFAKYTNCNIILKMNCEGEEYAILEELLQSGLLGKFRFMMLEWHYRGKELILNYLKEAGISWWCLDKGERIGFIYAYNNQVI